MMQCQRIRYICRGPIAAQVGSCRLPIACLLVAGRSDVDVQGRWDHILTCRTRTLGRGGDVMDPGKEKRIIKLTWVRKVCTVPWRDVGVILEACHFFFSTSSDIDDVATRGR